MYVLDTNVLSELRKKKSGKADRHVIGFIDELPPDRLFVSAISMLELEIGVRQMELRDPAQGLRLREWLGRQVLPNFENRILPVDTDVALRSAALHVPNRRFDRDAMIAATALVHRMTVVTRNTIDFASTGVDLIDPWRAGDA